MSDRRVLLVEDNRLLRWCVCSGLTQHGFQVLAPETVEEVIGKPLDPPPAVLITDWRLSAGHDGFDVLQRVRRQYPGIGSVLISAEADDQLSRRAHSAGFDFVIEKPCPVAEIVEAVSKLSNGNGHLVRAAQ
jgi:two-component system nitrogen regulation response regulator GlnG